MPNEELKNILAATAFAEGSVRLEGGKLSEPAQAIKKRFETGEITIDQMMDELKALYDEQSR